MRVLFLDVDGVLNRTGYEPAETVGLRSWIEPELADRLRGVLHTTGASIVLASDWRLETELDELRAELTTARLDELLIGATPDLAGQARWREIEAWMIEHALPRDAIVIVDDTHDMGPLSPRWVRIDPAVGLDEAAARAIVALYGD